MKQQLREYITVCLTELSQEEKQKESRRICEELLKAIPQGSVVCAYHPMKNEVDILPLLEELLRRGDRLFLPCIEKTGLVFRRVTDLNALCVGELGSSEPQPGAETLQSSETQVVLVPGRAFDKEGNRLGRGGGMYDQWLGSQRQENPEAVFIGVAFNCQRVDRVPTEAHDERVDYVVTAQLLDAEPLPELLRTRVPKYPPQTLPG